MISPLSNNPKKIISEQLFTVFEETRKEITDLALQAPENIVESVHLIRKRLKFLRAFTKLTGFCSDGDDYKEVNIRLRDCGRLISDCRDAHVRSILLDEFKQSQIDDSCIPTFDELIERNNVQTGRIEKKLLAGKNVFEELHTELNKESITNYFFSLDCDTETLLEGYLLGYKKSYHAFHSELTSHEAGLLHEWRKRTKDLQYQMELLTGIIPDDLPPTFREVSELNDNLGRINDLFMFSDWLLKSKEAIPRSDGFSRFMDLIHQQIDSLEELADKAGHLLYRFSPEEYQYELKTMIIS